MKCDDDRRLKIPVLPSTLVGPEQTACRRKRLWLSLVSTEYNWMCRDLHQERLVSRDDHDDGLNVRQTTNITTFIQKLINKLLNRPELPPPVSEMMQEV